MADKAVKIIEISGTDWMSGLSAQKYMPLGGIFKDATNFDPFEESGIWLPSLVGTRQGTAQVAGTIKHIVPWVNTNDNNLPYFYGIGDGVAYAVKSFTPYTVSAVNTGISGITTARGATRFKGKILYADDSTVKINSIPVAATSQSNILTGLATAEHIMHIAPDRNCYVINGQYVGRITSVAGTAGNSSKYLTFEDDVTTRDLADDGKHLIIIGDTSGSVSLASNQTLNSRCFVAFWNMKSQDLTQIWEFKDSRLYSVEVIEDEVVIVGADNVYVCNVETRIKPLMPFRNNPTVSASTSIFPAATIRRGNGVALWGHGTEILGYGRPHPNVKKTLFKLNTTPFGTRFMSLYHDGSILWGSVDDGTLANGRLYDFNTGTTLNSSSLKLTDLDFKRPYEFAYAKVVLREAMSSGESITLEIITGDGARDILNSRAVTHTADGALTEYIYYPEPNATAANQTLIFNDITDFTVTSNGPEVRRLEIWAYPRNPRTITGF